MALQDLRLKMFHHDRRVLFALLELDRCGCAASRLDRCTPGEKPLVPTEHEVGLTQGRSGRHEEEKNISSLKGIEPQFP
jgi:hypothetical protein